MKLRVMLITAVFAMLFLIEGILYAANGDLIVNGNSTVQGNTTTNGSSTVQGNTTTNGNAIVNGNTIVNGNLGVGTSTPQSKAEINGNAVVNGNLTVQGTITAPNAHVMTKYYESPEQTITANGTVISVARGLGVRPVLVQVVIVCKTAQFGYAVGDETTPMSYDLNGLYAVHDQTGVWWNSTNVGFVVGPNGIKISDRTAGTVGRAVAITNVNWKLIFRAWAM